MQTRPSFIRALLLVALTACQASGSLAAESTGSGQTLYAGGSQKSFTGPRTYFTGDVKVDMLFPANDTAHYSGAYVTFQPGARTAWHSHPAGQHMVVTSGTGLTGTRDGKIIEIKAGDSIWCPPNIDHWHGAIPGTAMTHLVITGSKNGGNVVWKKKVTDAEYRGNNPGKVHIKNGKSVGSLTVNEREIATVSSLASMDGLDSQLKSHIAINVGLTEQQLSALAGTLTDTVGRQKGSRTEQAIKAVLTAKD